MRMALSYRAAALAGVATQLFWGLLRVFVFLAFFRAARSPALLAMNVRQVIDYVWLGQAFYALMPVRADPSVEAMMRDGTIAYELARPVDLYSYWFARSASLRIAPTLLRAPPLLLLSALLVPRSIGLSAPSGPAGLALFSLSLLLGVLISSALMTLLSVFTLHTLKGEGAALLLTAGAWILSSMVPAPLLPSGLRTLMEWSPFAATMDLPFRFYVGQITAGEALPILLRQLGWALLLVLMGQKLLGSALARVVVQGG
jgi:ABC-2 type transport system permease protein